MNPCPATTLETRQLLLDTCSFPENVLRLHPRRIRASDIFREAKDRKTHPKTRPNFSVPRQSKTIAPMHSFRQIPQVRAMRGWNHRIPKRCASFPRLSRPKQSWPNGRFGFRNREKTELVHLPRILDLPSECPWLPRMIPFSLQPKQSLSRQRKKTAMQLLLFSCFIQILPSLKFFCVLSSRFFNSVYPIGSVKFHLS